MRASLIRIASLLAAAALIAEIDADHSFAALDASTQKRLQVQSQSQAQAQSQTGLNVTPVECELAVESRSGTRHQRTADDAEYSSPCVQQTLSLESLFDAARRHNRLNQTDLFIGALFDGIENDTTEIDATELAVKHVNERQILPGFNLRLVYNFSNCNPGTATDALHDIIFRKKTVVALLGPTCNNATQTLAEIVQYWNLAHLSFGATLPTLNDRNMYKTFSRVCISKEAFKMAVQRFLQSHNWSRAALLVEDRKPAILTASALVKHLDKHGINVTTQQVFKYVNSLENDIVDAVRELKLADVRIVVVIMDEHYIPDVFCAVYRSNLYGRRYVWLLSTVHGWMHPSMMYWTDYVPNVDARDYFRRIFRERVREQRCTESEIMHALQNVFLTKPLNAIADPEKPTSFGMTLSKMTQAYLKNIKGKLSVNFYFAYDAVWTVALAIARYILIDDYELAAARRRKLTEPNYNNRSEVTREIIGLVDNTSFVGMSGTVRFREADRVGLHLIKQVQNNRMVLVAMHETTEFDDHLDLECDGCHPINWENNRPPIDQSRTQLHKLQIDHAAVICVTVLTCVCLIICILLLAFNIYYRHLKFIKLSSPQLNNAAIGGCILVYCGLFLLGLEEVGGVHGGYKTTENAVICPLRMLLFAAGFSFSFGAIFVKTYRVFSIFKFSQVGLVKRRMLKDEHLLGVVVGLFVIDILLTLIWELTDPLVLEEKETYIPELSETNSDVILVPHYSQCSSKYYSRWCLVIYVLKGVLLLFGVFMAWSTRNVKIDVLNDSRYIAMNIYNVLLTSVVVLLIAELLKDRPTLWFVSISTLVLTSTTSALLMLFIPKIYTVFKLGGETPVTSEGFTVESKTRRLGNDKDIKELMHRAEVQNRVYKWKLHEMEAEVQRLEQILREPVSAYPKISVDDIALLPESAVDVSSRHPHRHKNANGRELLHSCSSDAISATEDQIMTSEYDCESGSRSQKSSVESKTKTGSQLSKKGKLCRNTSSTSSMLVYNAVRQLAVPVVRQPSQRQSPGESGVERRTTWFALENDHVRCTRVTHSLANILEVQSKLKLPRDHTSEFSEISCDQSTYI